MGKMKGGRSGSEEGGDDSLDQKWRGSSWCLSLRLHERTVSMRRQESRRGGGRKVGCRRESQKLTKGMSPYAIVCPGPRAQSNG